MIIFPVFSVKKKNVKENSETKSANIITEAITYLRLL